MASSSSSRPYSGFDVFLSFRGETRTSFSDHLYTSLSDAGVPTFRDKEGIREGNDISDELKQAIEGCEVSVVVFSKNYAQSRWCLNELLKMMECQQKGAQKILPIFYHVTPEEVRKQTGEFGIALNQHIERFGEEIVNGWKAALTNVANLAGYHITEDRYESGIIKIITQRVLMELNHAYMDIAKYPVGTDSRVKDIENLLQSPTNDGVKMIGIFGMGGVGKTTLAKVIYNRNFRRFDGSCFIANIGSEVSGGALARIQEKLVGLKRKMHEIENADHGITLIQRVLSSTKVLIVLDDINSRKQLDSLARQRNWFGPDSIIIITTRDVQLLSNLREHEKYEVNMLSFNESLQLLSLHALDVSVPNKEYSELSETIARYTKGLPLALEVIGSRLHRKPVQGWTYYAEKLKKMPPGDVQKILKISYDALDDDHAKNIFLDIACFFIGDDKNNTVKILEACNFVSAEGIEILRERCLLKINKSGNFEMHDLIRDMGREIVRMESPREPGKRSRLVDPKDIIDVLRGKKGTDAIEGMIVNSNMLKDEPFSTEAFAGMKNLRILILDGLHLRGSLEYLSHELRLFRLRNCHFSCSQWLSDSFLGKLWNLVELDMSRSNIKEFQPDMKHLTCLKILKLDDCEVEKTPDFTGAHSLEKVFFRSCSKLVEVHHSIGSLNKLLVLDFNSCSALKVLPAELGNLEKLSELNVRVTAIRNMPAPLRGLRNLKNLDLSLLRSTRTTRGHAGLLPPSVAELRSLERLSTHSTILYEIDLPVGLGSLTSLTNLHLSGCFYIQDLPFSLRDLSNLKNLNLDDWQNLRVLKDLPPTLESLSAGNCVSLEKIADISTLQRLQKLNIPNCKNLAPIPGLETLENLQLLEIRNCSRLTPVENWFQARSEGGSEDGSEGDSVKFRLEGSGVGYLACRVPTLLGPKFIRTDNPAIIEGPLEGLRISVSSTTTDRWVEFKDEYNYSKSAFTGYKIDFKVPRITGERLEVYAEFTPSELTLCLFEIQRNRDGEWRFFPSTRGWLPSAWGYLQQGDDEPTTSHREKRLKLLQVDEPTTSHRENRPKLLRVENLSTSITRGFRPKEYCCWLEEGKRPNLALGGKRIVGQRPSRPSEVKSSILTAN
ncbi:TMV resistance protein N-like [Ipomoea triloba]|uniref:TMV resistance protein N-like n=1 Tax=Ipomoea triloba TaxID=35885 RepID=UPI00125D2DBB|nr:TMV resistance protein N-like [Ipomoea triloba]XP_031122164.1 TMV resistance protein N-like [Ipomoea triloba]XP_031122165.1 TMV resistance protein N-like [Ipomoea triloba]